MSPIIIDIGAYMSMPPSCSSDDSVQGKERAGEKIYKGHHSYDLMLNLQLGIRFSVGRVSADDNPKELAPEHFSFLVPHLPAPAQHAPGHLAILIGPI